MALDNKGRVETRADRNVGNIYKRLDEARRQREQALETPPPANLDREARLSKPRPFPRLKPPRNDMPTVAEPHRLEWMVPVVLGLAILAVIMGFAVG